MVIVELEQLTSSMIKELSEELEEDVSKLEFCDLCEMIQSWSLDIENSADCCYLWTTYTVETKSYTFSVSGSQYIKDSCLCDLELTYNIEVNKLSLFKRIKKYLKCRMNF